MLFMDIGSGRKKGPKWSLAYDGVCGQPESLVVDPKLTETLQNPISSFSAPSQLSCFWRQPAFNRTRKNKKGSPVAIHRKNPKTHRSSSSHQSPPKIPFCRTNSAKCIFLVFRVVPILIAILIDLRDLFPDKLVVLAMNLSKKTKKGFHEKNSDPKSKNAFRPKFLPGPTFF